MTATDESTLTERQQAVLRLHRAGKSPTEIGHELEISSQAVHGHFRRLRAHGLVRDTERTPAPKRAPRNGRPFDPASALTAVKAAIAEQRAQLDGREAEIEAAIEALRDEKKQIAAARRELEKLMPPEPAKNAR